MSDKLCPIDPSDIKKYKFAIIPDEQTPYIPPMEYPIQFAKDNYELLIDFLKFADTFRTAVGLAGNQVSLNGERFMERVFALRDMRTGIFTIVINPVINEYIGIKEIKIEGCLTWGKAKNIVSERSRAVNVSYYLIDGTYVQNEIHKGFEAQIWQHEINHLNGIAEQVEDYTFELPKQKQLSRNDQCTCGSGKKYKNCCMLLT